MKSAKKGKKQGRARHLDGSFWHFTSQKIAGVWDEMDGVSFGISVIYTMGHRRWIG